MFIPNAVIMGWGSTQNVYPNPLVTDRNVASRGSSVEPSDSNRMMTRTLDPTDGD